MTTDDDLDIPAFLRREDTPAARAKIARHTRAHAAPPRMPIRSSGTRPWGLPKTMTPEAWALLREQERAREAKKAARLAALKDRRGE